MKSLLDQSLVSLGFIFRRLCLDFTFVNKGAPQLVFSILFSYSGEHRNFFVIYTSHFLISNMCMSPKPPIISSNVSRTLSIARHSHRLEASAKHFDGWLTLPSPVRWCAQRHYDVDDSCRWFHRNTLCRVWGCVIICGRNYETRASLFPRAEGELKEKHLVSDVVKSRPREQ